MEHKWVVYGKRADFKTIGEKYGIDQVVARVMRNRDIVGDEEISRYLHGRLTDAHAPGLMKDMDKACRIISEKIAQGKSIRIISDYDVDGVTSNYILYDGLKNLGADISYEIPDRMLDGYGINERIIRDALADGIDTIITCDNGIAAFEAIELAKNNGMTVIITDHHDIPYDVDDNGDRIYKIVPADAIIDNKQIDCEYPFKGLCGAGVAYKFIRQLYHVTGIAWENEEKYIDILAIGTVCDVMELVDENRIFVKHGLKVIEKTKITGLKALLSVNNLLGKEISAYHLGFIIGPCINASGRLESAKRGLKLLLETDPVEAEKQAKELHVLNATRKDMTNKGVDLAIKKVADEYMEDKVLVVYMPNLHESLAGIVAGKVREHYYKPVLIITDSDGELVKGSARSIEGYHMYDALNECSHLLKKFGGHELAAGFSLEKGDLEKLRRELNARQKLTEEELTPVVRLDVPMPVNYISYKLIEDLKCLEPFGKGNEKPVFGQSGLKVKRVTMFGSEKRFARIIFMDNSGYNIEAVDFNGNKFIEAIKMWFSDEECDRMLKGLSNGVILDVAYYPDVNEYNGNKSIQIKPITYRKHED